MNALTPLRTRLSPWTEFEDVQDRMNRMFGLIPRFGPEETAEWIPPVNLVELDNEFLLTAELPGLTIEDTEVDIEDNVLILRGEKEMETEKKVKDARSLIKERSYGAFQRTFTLPRSVVPEKIVAEFKEGVLTVHLPKREDTKSRRVEIKTK